MLSRDPIFETTREPYAYAADDPANGVDPTGLILGIPNTPSWSQIGTRYVGFVDGVTSKVDPLGYGTADIRDALDINGGLDTCSADYTIARGVGNVDGYAIDATAVLRALGAGGYRAATRTRLGNVLFGRRRPGGLGTGPLGSPPLKGALNRGPFESASDTSHQAGMYSESLSGHQEGASMATLTSIPND